MRKKKIEIIKELAGGESHSELTDQEQQWLKQKNWRSRNSITVMFSRDPNYQADRETAEAIRNKLPDFRPVYVIEHGDREYEDSGENLRKPEIENNNLYKFN